MKQSGKCNICKTMFCDVFLSGMAHCLFKQKITIWKLWVESWQRSAVILNYMSCTCHFWKSSKTEAGCLCFLSIVVPSVLWKSGSHEPSHSNNALCSNLTLVSVRSITRSCDCVCSVTCVTVSVKWLNVNKTDVFSRSSCLHRPGLVLVEVWMNVLKKNMRYVYKHFIQVTGVYIFYDDFY